MNCQHKLTTVNKRYCFLRQIADNQSMRQKTVSFQPNPDLLRLLKEQAEAQDRSVSWLINHYIKKGMEAEKLIKPQEKKPN